MIATLNFLPTHNPPVSKLTLTAVFLGKQELPLRFLAGVRKRLDPAPRMQQFGERFACVAFVVLSELR